MTSSEQTPERRPAAGHWTLPVLAVAFLVGILLIGILLSQEPRPANAPAASPPPAATAATLAEVPPAHGSDATISIDQITVADARARYDAGMALFVDVRPGKDYTTGHIVEAASIASDNLEARLQSLPPGAVIIVYAARADEEKSVRGAQIFKELGYPNVVALQGGLETWQEQGYPVAAGE